VEAVVECVVSRRGNPVSLFSRIGHSAHADWTVRNEVVHAVESERHVRRVDVGKGVLQVLGKSGAFRF